jgi:hypothetical protein
MLNNRFAISAYKVYSSRSISSLGGSFIQSNDGNMSLGAKVTLSAVIGGTAEKLGGGKFANGAVTGAYVMMFNHLASEVKERNREYIDHWKGIDHDKGGFIDNKEEFLEFMYDMAKYNSVEVSAFELSDGLFYVEPWHNNDSRTAWTKIDDIPGYTRPDVVAQYHTHPNSSFPSIADARFSAKYGKPVYTLGANGNMWVVSYRMFYKVPYHRVISEGRTVWFPYGKKLQ